MANNSSLDPATAQRTATLISLSLAMGVTLYTGVSWFLHQQGTMEREADPQFAQILIYAWIGVTAVSAFASLWFWRNRVEPLISGTEPLPLARLGELMSMHLVCIALIEGPALFGVTIYFLSGIIWPALVSVFLIWFVVLSTRPQTEWFERFR